MIQTSSDLPALARLAFEPLVEFGDIGHLHVRSVPLHFPPGARVLRQISENGKFRQPRAVFERRGRLALAGAAGVNEIRKNVLGPRQGYGRLGKPVHFFHWNNVHSLPISLRCK